MQIPLNEIEFLSLSADPSGRVFRWKGGIYRGIKATNAEFYKEILNRAVIKKLIAAGLLIDTEPTGFSLDGYEIVLKHRSLPFVSSPYEWCFQAFKDAALLVLDIQRVLVNEGLALYDPDPWNVVFDGCRPIYVDFCSIRPISESRGWVSVWDEYLIFLDLFSNPRFRMAEGQGRIIRLLLQGSSLGVLKADVAPPGETPAKFLKRKLRNVLLPLLGDRVISILKAYLRLQETIMRKRRDPELVRSLASRVEAIEFPAMHTQWSDYYESFSDLSPSDEWDTKQQSVHELISRFQPRSILDIGCNRGWYAQMATALGSMVVAFDYDEVCVNRLYKEAKARKLDIHPVVMDVLSPSPPALCAYGQVLGSAVQRFRCEMVLALAIVHHLVFGRKCEFDRIASTLGAFTEKYLAVEFISKDDEAVKPWWTEDHSWYTMENFEKALGHYFSKIERRPSYPESRVLLVCEK